MIALFHIIYWSINQIYRYFHNTNNAALPQNKKCDFDENYFEINKIKYCNATLDAETGLKFDPPVYLQRYTAVHEILLNKNVREHIKTVVDFGCGELKFFKYLKNSINIQNVLLVDIDANQLEDYSNRVEPFNADYLCRRKTPLHVEILQGSIDYPDPKLMFVDAVICIEIIEHLYPDTLDALPQNIFHFIEPRVAIFTTPNSDFNVLFTNFSGIRHYDHKFEWSRQQFQDWANNITLRYPKYSVYFVGVGPGPAGTEALGCCSQMAVFIKTDDANDNSRKLDLFNSYQKNGVIDKSDLLNDCFSYVHDDVSVGVCTYQSYVHNNYFKPLKVIKKIDYPYEIDHRSEEEIILNDTQYRMYRLGYYSRIYCNEDNFRTEIPLFKLTINDGGEFISVQELRKILEKAGYQIEECEINNVKVPCVIYEDISDEHSETNSSHSYSQSHTPDLNYSTDVNWDSESQWDVESTTVESTQLNMEMGINKTESIILWDESSQHEQEQQQQQQQQQQQPTENDSPNSDPCVSGEHTEQHEQQTDEKVELLFDSGYQVSTSSIDLSPEFMKDWLQEEKSDFLLKADAEHLKQTKSDKPHHVNSGDCIKPRDLKSEGQMKNMKKANKNEDRVVQLPPPPVVVPPQVVPQIIEQPEQQEIVENGDLANNNRDREGNNYQAAENLILDDNAIPRPENLDEHNENHIVLDEQVVVAPNIVVIEQIGDFQEDDDVNESVDEASREVQFDQNSELSFSDESLVIHGIQMACENYNILGRPNIPVVFNAERESPIESQETFETAAGFPIWLLQMLNMSTDDPLGIVGEDAHFFSQGDGLGIHPSTININDDDSTSSSDRSGSSVGVIAIAAMPSHPNSATATLASDVDMSFYEALESGHVTHVFLDVNDVVPGERIMYPRTQNNFAQTEPLPLETVQEVPYPYSNADSSPNLNPTPNTSSSSPNPNSNLNPNPNPNNENDSTR